MAVFTVIIFVQLLNYALSTDCVINNTPEHITWQKELLEDIKCIDKQTKPPSDNVIIYMKFDMKYFSFNSEEELFLVHDYLTLSWKDERLKWDPEKYHGFNAIDVVSHKLNIWHPNFGLYNLISFMDYEMDNLAYCELTNTGYVTYVGWLHHEAWCDVKLTNWPYDVQECSLQFAGLPPENDNYTAKFIPHGVTIEEARNSGEWYILNYTQTDSDRSSRVKLTFFLAREAAGLAAIVIHPALVLAALNITSIFLDVRRNVRLGLACFSLFNHYFFLTELVFDIPRESAYSPTLLLYYRGSIILTMFIILLTLMLAAILKFKITPHDYINSVNDFVYDGYKKYFVFPRWDFEEDGIKYSEDWTKFANIVNSASAFIIVIAYIGLYGSLMPKPVSVNLK